MARTLSSLPIGSNVKDVGSRYYGKDIIFKKIAENHPGYPQNSVTLITDKIICLKSFDARENNSPYSYRRDYGNNRYMYSNIRQWLNSENYNWYTPRHSYDEPPTRENVWRGYNSYNNEPGFMTNLTLQLKKMILATNLKVNRTNADGDGADNITDKIFFLSTTEVGLKDVGEGTFIGYFTDDYYRRRGYPTQEVVDNSEYSETDNVRVDATWPWWLRTPDDSISCNVYSVYTGGTLNTHYAALSNRGVRPALNLSSKVLVSDTPDSDGAYIIISNKDPILADNTPNNKIFYEGEIITINGSAKDTDSGNVVTIKYKINNGTTRAMATGISNGTTSLNYSKILKYTIGTLKDGNTTIASGLVDGQTYKITIWAEDDQGGKSAEVVRNFTVIPNRAPVLTINPIENQTNKINSEKLTISGTVTDADENDVIVDVKINNNTNVRVYSGVPSDFSYDIKIDDLKEGENTITVTSKDTFDFTTTKTIKLNKTRNVVPLKTAIARYKISPPTGSVKEILTWIQTESGDLTIHADVSMVLSGEREQYNEMNKIVAPINNLFEEKEFSYKATEAKDNITLKLKLNKSNIESIQGIKQISGVLG